MSRIFLAAVAVAALSLAGQASAEMAQPKVVKTHNVNFSDPVAVNDLYQRLVRAADSACRAQAVDSVLAPPDRGCVADALARAVAQANRPMLTARYESGVRSGTAVAQAYR